MELPLGGPALRHYTQSRPRPHRQKLNYRPSRPQETILESENEGLEFMGRVDEGVEEFFTKKVLPTDALKKQDEEAITVHEVAPASSAPCPPPTKTLRRKLGDFFTLKKRRALKSETSQEGRPKKASIADFIRPLREKEKDKDKLKEHDKENEKEKGKEHPPGVTSETAVQETPAAGVPPLRGEVAPPRRALREGKSQSLILLSGSSAGTANSRNPTKKQLEGQHSFEQKLHLMLQRIGVSKAQPEETQNQEGEMKKAESEGTIIDSKPEPPPTFTKPRTMSASSDTRHQIRPSVSAHESAGKPALLPKPVLKPGPPPTTSGRNTPENELSQIEEGEIKTPTKLSPAAAPPATAARTPTATTPPSVTTISNSVPDSKPPSSTVLPSDADICTDSAKATTAAIASTIDTDLNIRPSVPEANASGTELPTASISAKTSDTTAPTELPTSSTVTPSKSMTPSPSVTSDSTVTAPPISMLETFPAAADEYPVSATSPGLSAKLPGLESSDVAFSVTDSEAISVITVASSPATSVSRTSSSVTEVVGQSITTKSHTSESLIPSSAIATPPPPDAVSTITPDTPVTSSVLVSTVLPITTPTTTTTTTTSLDPISASTITADISSPHTSASETSPTETTYTTTTSTIHADTTSVASLATTATIKSPLSTDADPHSTGNGDAALTPAISGLPSTDNTHITAHLLTSPAPCQDSTEHDKESQASEDRDCVGPAEESSAGVKLEEVPAKIQNGNDGPKKVSEDEKESGNEYNKPAVADTEAARKEVQEERKNPEEEVRTEVAEPASEKDAGQEEEKETTSAHKK